MARVTPVNAGYTIINGSGTGINGNRIDVWMEYQLGEQNIVENYTPITVYFYAALADGKQSNTEQDYGMDSALKVDGNPGVGKTNKGYYFTKPNYVNDLGSFTGNIPHNADGTKTLTLEGSFTTRSSYISGGAVSAQVELPAIAKASDIDSALDVTLGNKCSVKFTPKAASFRFKLEFSCGEWAVISDLIHPNTINQYTYTGTELPLEVARQFVESSSTMNVVLYTYSDSEGENLTGTNDASFTVYVPDNSETKPTVSMSLTPGKTPISGLYIQGLSTVQADISATDPYGANIEDYSVTIGGTSYGPPYDSEYLNTTGAVKVTGYATNSRGFIGSAESSIDVIAYSRPQIQNVSVVRCTQDGTQSEDGTYLRISATRNYSKVMSGDTQHNHCQIRYRYRAETVSEWSDWSTILETDASGDAVITDALLGNLSTEKVYIVQVGVIDTLGFQANATITIATKSVFMHRRAGGKAMGLGKYVEEDNLLDVAWDARFRGKVTVEAPVNDTDAVNKAYVDALIAQLQAQLGL